MTIAQVLSRTRDSYPAGDAFVFPKLNLRRTWQEFVAEVEQLACGLLGLTVAEALCAATRNAAETLGLPGPRGRIEAGAVADLVLLDVPNHLFLGYQVGWNPVQGVVKDGRPAWLRELPSVPLL